MRYLIPLLLLVFISSCGTNQIRYVRSKGQAREIVESTPTEKQNNTAQSHKEQTIAQNNVITPEYGTYQEAFDPTYDTPVPTIQEPVEESVSDLNITNNDEEDERIAAAKSAEKSARKARKNLRLSVIFLALSFIPFLSILFFLPALILLIIGFVHYLVANSSRYITQEGEDMLKASKIFLLVWLIIILLFAVLTTWLLFMFL